jgi:RNA polymerase sigma factor (sigma-70 family)
MPETVDDFAVLLARARAGDQAALVELARKYEPEVRIVAHVLLGPALRPHLDSMDLVQSVHRSLMLGLRNRKFDISSPEKLVALALTMVHRKVARHWRHLKKQQRPGPATPEGYDLFSSLISPQLDPARAVQLQDALEHLWHNLDQTEKRVIELRLEGCSTAEVGRRLELDADILRVRLSRLRQRLRATGVLSEWL